MPSNNVSRLVLFYVTMAILILRNNNMRGRNFLEWQRELFQRNGFFLRERKIISRGRNIHSRERKTWLIPNLFCDLPLDSLPNWRRLVIWNADDMLFMLVSHSLHRKCWPKRLYNLASQTKIIAKETDMRFRINPESVNHRWRNPQENTRWKMDTFFKQLKKSLCKQAHNYFFTVCETRSTVIKTSTVALNKIPWAVKLPRQTGHQYAVFTRYT